MGQNKKKNKHIKLSKKPYLLIIDKIANNDRFRESKEILNFQKKMSPLSGDEQNYDPDIWNKNHNIKNTHNCYTYALGKIIPGLNSKAQPGYASGYDHIEDDQYECKYFYDRLKNDSPGSYVEKFDNGCLPGFYKVFLALDPGNDYHWWKQNSDSFWSHKPGSTNVVNVDAKGQKIMNPLLASRDYESINYKKPCFFACIYSDLARSISDIYNK
jgi:hypothetical protein